MRFVPIVVVVVLVGFVTLHGGTPALAQTTEEEEGSFYIRTYSPNEDTHCTVGPYVEGQGEVGPYGWFCVPSNIKYSYSEYDPTVIDETGGTADATEVDECGACAACRDDCVRVNQTETEYETCVRTNAAVCIPDDCHDDQQRLKMEACKQPFELCVAKFHEFLASDAKASTGYVYEWDGVEDRSVEDARPGEEYGEFSKKCQRRFARQARASVGARGLHVEPIERARDGTLRQHHVDAVARSIINDSVFCSKPSPLDA